jgi:hypothetical protein
VSGGARRAALLAVAVLLALSGCTTIPTQGPVNVGAVQDPGAANRIGLFPARPTDGASPEEIVNGFLAAATGQQDDYGVARSYLAPGLQRRWNPRARVLVNDGGTNLKATGASVAAAVPVVGRLDAHGVYTTSETATTTALHFHLAKVKGQWRIDRAANGIVLGQPLFDRLFGPPVTLSFFDPSFRRLYPDLRWFPTRSDSGLATAKDVVDALLAGPSAPLGSGVTASPFPRGTRRAGLSITGDVATVDLATPGGAPPQQVQQRMLTALRASLRGVGAIGEVRLSLGGVERPVSPVQTVQAPDPNPQPVGLSNRSFGVLEGTKVVSDALQRAVGALGPSAVTISESQGIAAVGTVAGVSVVTRSGNRTAVRLVDRRADLVDPALDAEGWVYSVPRGRPDSLVAFDRAGRAAPVASSLPAGSIVRSIEVSRDGSRLLALLETAGRPSALVAGIVRDGSGRPLRLTAGTYPVAVGTGSAVDATWVDPGSVAVVTQDQDGDQVTVQRLGGESSSAGRLPGGVTDAVGGTSRNDLTIRTQNGALFTAPQGAVWVATGATAQVLAVQR